jgi:flagellar basal body-associated protein FliL
MVMIVVDPGAPSGTERPCPAAVWIPLIVMMVVLSLGTAVTVTLFADVGALTP